MCGLLEVGRQLDGPVSARYPLAFLFARARSAIGATFQNRHRELHVTGRLVIIGAGQAAFALAAK
ncbi:MAG: hypothetical protein K0M55_02170, partial [Rhizobium sp.]|nr:hypothetical protein [Rhizobium sp.]